MGVNCSFTGGPRLFPPRDGDSGRPLTYNTLCLPGTLCTVNFHRTDVKPSWASQRDPRSDVGLSASATFSHFLSHRCHPVTNPSLASAHIVLQLSDSAALNTRLQLLISPMAPLLRRCHLICLRGPQRVRYFMKRVGKTEHAECFIWVTQDGLTRLVMCFWR